MILRERDAPVGNLNAGVGACQLGRINEPAIKTPHLRCDDTSLTGCDTGGSLSAQLDRLIDLEGRLLLATRVTIDVAGKILSIHAY